MPIVALLEQGRDPRAEVARSWDHAERRVRSLSWRSFRDDVSSLCERLSREPTGRWILLTEDSYAFAVGLFGLWHSGSSAILPPNRQPGSLERLGALAVGAISDRPEWLPGHASIHPIEHGATPRSAALPMLEREQVGVELFTSGTTGEEKPVEKRLRHLEDEVVELEAKWGETIGDATVFCSASAQHLYGLLFGVLWPLSSGRVFHTQQFLHAGELVPRMSDAEASVLVSIPTSLKRVARHAGMADVREICRAVFSSGGPLPLETARAVHEVLGRTPIEVFGSTETGGIASRSQDPQGAEALWTPFPSVRITEDPHTGAMRVRSPFVSVDEEDGFATSDRILVQDDGRFRLEGRTDQTVKVGAKRLDLAQMTKHLQQHVWVDAAALTTAERDAEPRVAAVIVPSTAGQAVLDDEGRPALCRGLREALAESWDPVLHPRLWRVVPELPEDVRGKVTRAALDALFRTTDRDAVDRPEILEEVRGSDFIERSCRVPQDLACFSGHFPGFPVVPGVVQLDWAMDLAEAIHGRPPMIEEIESLKLRSKLEPGNAFRLQVRLASTSEEAPLRMDFRMWTEEDTVSVGRVRLAGTKIPESRDAEISA